MQGRQGSIWVSADKIRKHGKEEKCVWRGDYVAPLPGLESEVPRKQTKGIIKEWLETAHTLSLKCNLIFGIQTSERKVGGGGS